MDLVRRFDHDVHCPQCGEDTRELHEGSCKECFEERQRELDLHNARYDHWQSLTDRERDDQIRRA